MIDPIHPALNYKDFLKIFFLFSVGLLITICLFAGYRFIHYNISLIIGILLFYYLHDRINKIGIDNVLDSPFYLKKYSNYFHITSILFFIGTIIAFIILLNNQYDRIPAIFFLLLALNISFILINILIAKKSFEQKIIIIQILFISFILRCSRHIVYPEGTPCRDGVYHILTIAGDICLTGYIPSGWTYSYYPITHIYHAIGTLITNLNIWISAIWIGIIITTLGALIVFIIGKKFYGYTIAFIAATLYAVYPFLIEIGSLVQPMSYTTVLIISLIFLIFQYINHENPFLFLLISIQFVALVLSHHYSAVQFLLFLFPTVFLALICQIKHKSIFFTKNLKIQTNNRIVPITIIFSFFILFYWIYVSHTFNWALRIFDFFRENLGSGKVIFTEVASSGSNLWVTYLNEIGFSLLIIFIIFGILVKFESTIVNFNFTIFSQILISITLVMYIGFSYIFCNVLEFLPWRTFIFLGLLSVFFAGVGIIVLLNIKSMIYLTIIICFIMTFFMITSTIAMADESPFQFTLSPPINSDIRPTVSSTKVSEILQEYYYSSTNIYFEEYIPWKTEIPKTKNDILNLNPIKRENYSNDYLILINREILNGFSNNYIKKIGTDILYKNGKVSIFFIKPKFNVTPSMFL